MKYPAKVPADSFTQADLKGMLPPGASVWRSRLGAGGWCGHLRPGVPRVSRSWAVAGHYESALFVLRELWKQYLDDEGFTKADCRIVGLF